MIIMRKKLTILAIALTAPLLTQCASQDQVNKLEYQLRVVNKKLQELESTTVNQIQQRQAASSGQMEQLQGQVLSLKSQLEETHHQNRRLKEQNKELEGQFKSYAELESQKREEELLRIQREQAEKERALAELNEKLRIQQENVKAIQQARVRDAERRAQAAQRAADLAKKKSSSVSGSGIVTIRATKKKIIHNVPKAVAQPVKTAVSKPASKPAVTKTPAKTPAQASGLSKADNLYKKGDYQGAYTLYEAHVNKSQDAQSTTTARYMMGECLFNQQQYDQAILQYQKIISINPQHGKAPAALLRQAQSFEQLKDKETAKLIYRKLLSSYGQSSEAAKAQTKLDTL